MSLIGEDVNTAITAIPAVKRVAENVGYILAGLLIVMGLGYRIGKEHAKYQKLCVLLQEVVESQKNYVTKEYLDEKQITCRGNIALNVQDQIASINSNICLIMGHQGITPVISNPIHNHNGEHHG